MYVYIWSSSCWFQEPSRSMRLGQCISLVYIFTNVDDINNKLIYVGKDRKNLQRYSISYKNKEFHRYENMKLRKPKAKIIPRQSLN